VKLERTQEWWLGRVDREENHTVVAGSLNKSPAPQGHPATAAAQSGAEETRIAFGRFVSLMRRQRSMTIERLAETADLELEELVSIEDDLHFMPEPRTVFCLANAFGVPQKSLMQLAGLASARDDGFRREAVRFAARSESVEKLSKEEKAALEAFIVVLSQGE
jgi:hypothetical protein